VPVFLRSFIFGNAMCGRIGARRAGIRQICYLSAAMKSSQTILLWLLLLVIPLQGLAANGMAICKASHQRVAVNVVSDHAMQHHGIGKSHAAPHQHQHQHKHDKRRYASNDNDGGGNLPTHDNSAPKQQLSSCSACAACSMGALWIASADVSLPALIAPSDSISYIAFHVPRVVPEPLEHPPRRFVI
jgi:hypothetical protein